MTTSIDERIKSLYEIEKLSPEQIAEEECFSITAVKAKLMQISSVYRRDCKSEGAFDEELNFSESELREVNQIIMDTARAAETADGLPDWKTRLQAAMYVRDDKKGRKEIRGLIGNMNNFNILNFNEKLVEVSERTKKMKEIAV